MDKQVEVAFATVDKQMIIPVTLVENATVQQAIDASSIAEYFSEIDVSKMKVGIFGKVYSLNKTVEQGERIEIYRSLQQDPMDARRNRALVAK